MRPMSHFESLVTNLIEFPRKNVIVRNLLHSRFYFWGNFFQPDKPELYNFARTINYILDIFHDEYLPFNREKNRDFSIFCSNDDDDEGTRSRSFISLTHYVCSEIVQTTSA